ncbi:MAG: hypothetical protein DRO05_00050 [Thermoproteota archaeon]|nr:MAG: hypothetical protein DRO05_00050 [Candidatus Korarchaeota archaeon]
MSDRERTILGREALYSLREFLKASLGSKEVFIKISRASKLEAFFLFWLLQSFLVIVGNYMVSGRIKYNYVNIPYWVTSADIWMIEDRAMNMAVIKSLLVAPGLLIALNLFRILIMKLLGERLGGEAYLSSAVTAFATTLVPECFRVVTIYGLQLLRLPSQIVIDFDLFNAKSARYLMSLGSKVAQQLSEIYQFNPWDVLIVTSIFLFWETYLFYRIFRIVYKLDVKGATIATLIISTVTGWINALFSLVPWLPKFYVDPYEFRPPPPPVPVG